MARFDNKVVLVSGGARGQGAAEARLLVAQGAKVVLCQEGARAPCCTRDEALRSRPVGEGFKPP